MVELNVNAELEQLINDRIADGSLCEDDADTIREFASFLSEVPRCRPVPVAVLRKYQDLTGLTDAEIDGLEQRRIARGEQP